MLHDKQKIITNDRTRFKVVCCGRRFGKTYLSAQILKFAATALDNANLCYIAPTFQLARDIMWDLLIKELGNSIIKKNETLLEITVATENGKTSRISLKSWEAVESLLGQAFDYIILDEVSKYTHFRYGWEEIISPTLIDRKGSALFISTPNGKNHFYDLYNKVADDWKSFHYTTYDNPFIPIEEIEREKKEKPIDIFQQEYLALFTQRKGLVYNEFNEKIHIYKNIPIDEIIIETIVGVDFGYEHPTAISYIYKTNKQNFYVYKEYCESKKINQEIILKLQQEKLNAIYPDPAEPSRIEEMRRFGLPVKEVNKDVLKGIDTIRTLLKNNKLFIHENCFKMIDEFQNYVYKEDKQGNSIDEVVKENDDLMDSLRYALFNHNPLTYQTNQNRISYFKSRYSRG